MNQEEALELELVESEPSNEDKMKSLLERLQHKFTNCEEKIEKRKKIKK